MNEDLGLIKEKVYAPLRMEVTNYQAETESQDYEACRYQLNGKKIISRSAKETPKKPGQFVTFWKRPAPGPIEPFHEADDFDYYIITVRSGDRLGQFVFPKSVLIAKGLVSTPRREGKRGFRVYPVWDTATNPQAIGTQRWQLNYFFEMGEDLSRVRELFKA
ncbi:MepB family protein [Reichenbachiella ulvae]|uniref:MepB family protein n=1 Tax=Reichenbachiella ulvae TaxID=2980104 RepID=A0ABT3CUD8_9BACT|nr:MepB family protein [Reichenbachiella ulvae]MCV9387173.1 MepB family protein [Reichenbachiella ulvae]